MAGLIVQFNLFFSYPSIFMISRVCPLTIENLTFEKTIIEKFFIFYNKTTDTSCSISVQVLMVPCENTIT